MELKEGVGNPKSLGCPYRLSHQIRVGGNHQEPGRLKGGSCPLGGALRYTRLLIAATINPSASAAEINTDLRHFLKETQNPKEK